jgi:hypothetical protein
VAAAGRTPSLWKVVAETPRTILIACVVTHLLRLLGAKNWKYCVIPGLSLWLFLNHEWVGAVMWEKTPRQIAAIASGNRSSPLWPDALQNPCTTPLPLSCLSTSKTRLWLTRFRIFRLFSALHILQARQACRYYPDLIAFDPFVITDHPSPANRLGSYQTLPDNV